MMTSKLPIQKSVRSDIASTCCRVGICEEEMYGAYRIFFGTLVSESRLRIINLLRKRAMCVSEIQKAIRADQSLVSHDLARLKRCGFVKSEVRGKFRRYSLNTKTIKPIMELIDAHMENNCVHILRGEKRV